MNPVTRSRSHLYAFLLCTVALCTYLLSNDWFKAHVSGWALCAIGAVGVVALNYRAYLDDSSSRVPAPGSTTETASVDVTRTTTPPTTEPPAGTQQSTTATVTETSTAPAGAGVPATPADAVPVTGGAVGVTENSD
jgi:hypothetical protein